MAAIVPMGFAGGGFGLVVTFGFSSASGAAPVSYPDPAKGRWTRLGPDPTKGKSSRS